MKIKYVPVDNALTEWGDKKSILVRWEGLNPYILNRWISEMRNHK